ncbi:uncharacterized protein TNCV_2813142 [Trichonephila clavipes]|nr:uncharacterized protein TNCV_2813142 [Trichonephila clavipes]
MWKDEVGMSVGCLMLMIIEEIGEIRKMSVERVMAEMILGVTMRVTVKEISGSKAGIDFRRMIEALTIGDTSLEIEVKRTVLTLVVSCVGRFGIPMYSWVRFCK